MSFFSGLSGLAQGISLAAQAAGVVGALVGAEHSADALEGQAVAIAALSEEEQRAIREIGEVEAALIEAEAGDEAAVLAFNRQVALDNAAWERRAAEVARAQTERAWERQVKSAVARFAASGTRLTGGSNEVIAGQLAEMERDLFLMELNGSRAAGRAEDQARLFSLQRDQVVRRGALRAEARRAVAAINADSAATAAASRAAAARSGAGTARIAGFGQALRGGAGLLGDIADFLN